MEFTEIGKGKSYQRIGRKRTVTTTYYRVLAEQKDQNVGISALWKKNNN